MGLFDFFKNKGKDTQKVLTLEDCIIKMFASADILRMRRKTRISFVVILMRCLYLDWCLLEAMLLG